ncbi:MAG TPA: DUF2807 domain-containing protein [Caulobacteraceae bacterium]|jgi:hypothetical protein|nr:DUF2807 domain-containing protein [Caulobacteraceae bacterium]
MRTLWSVLLAAIVLGWTGAAAAQTVSFKDVTARVVIIPEQRPDVQVIFLKTNPHLPMKLVKVFGDVTQVQPANWMGWFWGPRPVCDSRDDHPAVTVPGGGDIDYDDLPQIAVRVPLDAKVDAGGAIYGAVGRSQSLHLKVGGCGDWTIANVQDELRVQYAGSGRLHTGSAGKMTLQIAGAATVTTTEVADGLTLDIAGVGNVHMRKVSGPLGVHLAGGGDVHIEDGRATTMAVHIAGSGNVDYGGTADSLDANIAGSGDIRAAKVIGAVNKFIAGSGTVDVGP